MAKKDLRAQMDAARAAAAFIGEETSSMTTELEGTVERSSGMIEKLEGDMKVLADSMEHFRL